MCQRRRNTSSINIFKKFIRIVIFSLISLHETHIVGVGIYNQLSDLSILNIVQEFNSNYGEQTQNNTFN